MRAWREELRVCLELRCFADVTCLEIVSTLEWGTDDFGGGHPSPPKKIKMMVI